LKYYVKNYFHFLKEQYNHRRIISEIPKLMPECTHPAGELKYALSPQSGWGCMGGGATEHHTSRREITTLYSCTVKFVLLLLTDYYYIEN
jgi:hypothetical protein